MNYGGSTGYGREYRNRLRGQWGVVDVQDVVTAVTGLAEQGLADPARLAIEGGSAGGWTVLAALTTSDVFACGASYFGVAELDLFVQETHDFESRYVDGLIGPLPESADLYAERAPLNNVDGLNCPVLLLQGLDDPIVPPSQAERFRDALVTKGIPHAYLAYEGESHGFRKQSTIISSRNAELSFYGQVLGFTPPGIATLEGSPAASTSCGVSSAPSESSTAASSTADWCPPVAAPRTRSGTRSSAKTSPVTRGGRSVIAGFARSRGAVSYWSQASTAPASGCPVG